MGSAGEAKHRPESINALVMQFAFFQEDARDLAEKLGSTIVANAITNNIDGFLRSRNVEITGAVYYKQVNGLYDFQDGLYVHKDNPKIRIYLSLLLDDHPRWVISENYHDPGYTTGPILYLGSLEKTP